MTTYTARANRRNNWYGYLFISPMMLGFLCFLAGPIIYAFALSFTDYSLLHPASFVGLDNYVQLVGKDPLFWKTVGNTLYFSAGLIPLNLILALSLALLLNQKLPGTGLFRTAIFTPVVTSIVVWAIVWKYVFATDAGLLNQILGYFGMQGPAWLYDTALVMPVVIVVSVLKKVGMNMVIFLAALQDVPKMYYEAATIDGASKWRQFQSITLPMIAPSIFLTLIITLIGSLKVFSQIIVMTEGGPGTSTYVLVYYIYQLAYKVFDIGYASAVAFVLFFLVLVLTLVQWKFRKRWVHHEQ
ncbi:multiple sugar transport system permease protein [Paenibacillus endophyticus]|uniref:Multiple sugar transport system permease protein n=1 Tax=Paenibacillus endophyticus TaxID=1294268 RepID=A0A7W5CCM9_9BACL|nr:sugar ABC transporter permease [Paenibacillus endophyticus]MBB3155263.1 multiple sugar transport system permease protein [Paenibacillus endophyticus]